jgi:TPR repeat protein
VRSAALVVTLAAAAVARAEIVAPNAPAAPRVVEVAKQHLPEVSACYQKALLRKPWLAGRVVASFTVDASGRVTRVELERTDLADVRALVCIRDVIRAWPLGPGGRAFDFTYPFAFGGGASRDPGVLVDGRARPTVWPARCKEKKECRELAATLAFGDEGDQKRAFDYFSTGCELKDGASCAGAAAALDFGRGVAKDRARALKLAEKACGLGAQRACTAVAMSHALGLSDAGKRLVEPDAAKASALLERACTAKEPVACLALAERVRAGLGAAANVARADELERRALELDP